MPDLSPLVWFIATAVMTVTVLAVGTLGSANLLTRRQREANRRATAHRPRSEPRLQEQGQEQRAA